MCILIGDFNKTFIFVIYKFVKKLSVSKNYFDNIMREKHDFQEDYTRLLSSVDLTDYDFIVDFHKHQRSDTHKDFRKNKDIMFFIFVH